MGSMSKDEHGAESGDQLLYGQRGSWGMPQDGPHMFSDLRHAFYLCRQPYISRLTRQGDQERDQKEETIKKLLTVAQSATNWSRDWLADGPWDTIRLLDECSDDHLALSLFEDKVDEAINRSNWFLQEICHLSPELIRFIPSYSDSDQLRWLSHERQCEVLDTGAFSATELEAIRSSPSRTIPRPQLRYGDVWLIKRDRSHTRSAIREAYDEYIQTGVRSNGQGKEWDTASLREWSRGVSELSGGSG
jgi:hypothetical protein